MTNVRDQALPKQKLYADLLLEIKALLDEAWFTNCANAAAAIYKRVPRVNWAGFYLLIENDLVLGPFQGDPACVRIPLGKGVCGTAALRRSSVVVSDVHAFAGHIACDSRSRSEIVIPLILDGRLIGVLDVDSPSLDRFDADDQLGLEAIALTLIHNTKWPDKF